MPLSARIASSPTHKCSGDRVVVGGAFPTEFAESLIAVLIGPHRPANHARGRIVEHERLSSETRVWTRGAREHQGSVED